MDHGMEGSGSDVPAGDGNFAIRRFGEASEQECSLPGFAQRYHQLSPGRFEGSISSLDIPGFSILRERINVAVVQTFTAPEDRIVAFCAPSGAGAFRADGMDGSSGSCGVGRGWSRLGVSDENSDVIMVVAGPDGYDEASQPGPGDVSVGASAAFGDALFDWLVSLLAVYASGEASRSPELDALVADLLHDRLGRLLSDLRAVPAERSACDRRAYALHRRMRDWLKAHPHEPATVAGLSRALDITPADLRRVSLAVMGHPLDDLLLAGRLGQARRAIIAARIERRRISDIALDWGFAHWGRFARSYRDLFGETPSQTLRGT